MPRSKSKSKSRSRSRSRSRSKSPSSSPPKLPFPIADELDIDSITIYRHPLLILSYFAAFVAHSGRSAIHALSTTYLPHVLRLLGIVLAFTVVASVDGPHQPLVQTVLAWGRWYGSWIVLGVLSSVGLGSGLHTFLLFLGPHIAQITAAAYSCGHLDFETRTWEQITCTPISTPTVPVTLLAIAHKVHLDSFFWGLGTALGELPPYFVARAAARSGKSSPTAELDALLASRTPLSWADWAKVQVMHAMQRFGFWGILACASIPNPLFDLAGIICGTVGIKFRTFFGATLVGKAVVKTSIQSVFVAVLFSQGGQAAVLAVLDAWAPGLHGPVRKFLDEQMSKYLRTPGQDKAPLSSGGNAGGAGKWVGTIWNGLITLMLVFFLLSIVESLAKQEMERVLVRAKGEVPDEDLLLMSTISKRARSRSRSQSAPMSPVRQGGAPPLPLPNGVGKALASIKESSVSPKVRGREVRPVAAVATSVAKAVAAKAAADSEEMDADAEMSSSPKPAPGSGLRRSARKRTAAKRRD
ncbi:hypothetical protein BCR44DRAFT_118979 [Catenaria anguillulae PL171]|uniref:Uncharacterized protein n=1 Tax=Catenaria anguillulae PL171 TaxID=765915 RepID=A0A1Y2I0V0_9FUNG|nr:hypothetical protein BCR44DRAFT_118979 [Catenaria anguillulae PL171]